MRIVAYVVVANYAAIVLVYLTLGNYFDHIEPGLASVAWLVAQGAPMYPAPESAQQYGYLYGPLQFLLNAAVMRLLGPSILTSKLASAVLALVAALALYGAIRKDRSHECALIGTALLVLELFVAWPFTVVIARTDALMMGVVGLGLLGAVLRPGWVATALVGVSLGVAMNFKAHRSLSRKRLWRPIPGAGVNDRSRGPVVLARDRFAWLRRRSRGKAGSVVLRGAAALRAGLHAAA
jgi:4-amino-4-deoxy-L-arabinose transferase-like glycosyltransferase